MPHELGDDPGGAAPESQADVFSLPAVERTETRSKFLLHIEHAAIAGDTGHSNVAHATKRERTHAFPHGIVRKQIPAEINAGEVQGLDTPQPRLGSAGAIAGRIAMGFGIVDLQLLTIDDGGRDDLEVDGGDESIGAEGVRSPRRL